MKYDVFISCKSEDYPHGRQAYQFLSRNGLVVFFSDVTLGELRDADYRKRIDDAIDQSMHMVVVTSSGQNVRATWVESEWGIFVNDKLSDRKQGNLITLLVGSVVPADLPPRLRNYEAIKFDKAGLQRLLNYLPHEQGAPKSSPVSAVPTKAPAMGAIVVGILAIVSVVLIALYTNFLAHRSAQGGGNADSATPVISPMTTTIPNPTPPADASKQQSPTAVSAPEVVRSDPPRIAAPAKPASDLQTMSANPAADGALAVNVPVIVTVDSDLYWDAGGGREGNASKGQTGRLVQIDRNDARCLISFGAPLNVSAWIASSALRPSNP